MKNFSPKKLFTLPLFLVLFLFTNFISAQVIHRVLPNNAGQMQLPCGSDQLFRIRVMGQGNQPIQGVTIVWSSEAGSMSPTTSVTNVNGYACSHHTVGTTNGQSYLVDAAASITSNQHVFWHANADCPCTPAAVCKNATVYLDGSGSGSITANDVDGGSTLCNLTASVSPSSFGCSNLGSNAVTLTVGSSTCTANVTVIDNIAPTASCKNVSVTLAGGAASVSAADVNNGSTDNCSIASMTLTGQTSFTCADIGDHSVTLTVTDGSGNSSSCTSTVTVIGAIPDAQISASRNPVYYGYAPYSTSVLTASGGVSYVWNTTATTASITVAPTITTTYSVIATNQYGCTDGADITIQVIDVRCGPNLNKVAVCHGTGSASNPKVNICIATSAVATHLGHGDALGTCPAARHAAGTEVDAITIFPNPNSGEFTIQVPVLSDEFETVVSVFNALGQEVFTLHSPAGELLNSIEMTLPANCLPGLYLVAVTSGDIRYQSSFISNR